jgi:hypothetical protein
VQNDRRPGELHIIMRGQGGYQAVQVRQNEGLKGMVTDVARGDQQQLPGRAPKKQGVDEVGILGDYHTELADRDSVDFRVGGPVGKRKIEGVDDIVPAFTKAKRQA